MPLLCTKLSEHPVPGTLQKFRAKTRRSIRSLWSAALIGSSSSGMPDVKSVDVRNRIRRSMAAFVRDIVFLFRLLRHTETPWYARGLLCFSLMYLCSPVQLIPNFVPVVGQMDDLFVIWITKKCVPKLIDQKTRQECHDITAATELPFIQEQPVSITQR